MHITHRRMALEHHFDSSQCQAQDDFSSHVCFAIQLIERIVKPFTVEILNKQLGQSKRASIVTLPFDEDEKKRNVFKTKKCE